MFVLSFVRAFVSGSFALRRFGLGDSSGVFGWGNSYGVTTLRYSVGVASLGYSVWGDSFVWSFRSEGFGLRLIVWVISFGWFDRSYSVWGIHSEAIWSFVRLSSENTKSQSFNTDEWFLRRALLSQTAEKTENSCFYRDLLRLVGHVT